MKVVVIDFAATGAGTICGFVGAVQVGGPMSEGDILAFIRAQFRSIWTLELLLVMERDRDRIWTAMELVRELRASTAIVADGLLGLERAGLVAQTSRDGYAFHARSPELVGIAIGLRKLYAERPQVVIGEILSAPNDKVQSFADAFRFKK